MACAAESGLSGKHYERGQLRLNNSRGDVFNVDPQELLRDCSATEATLLLLLSITSHPSFPVLCISLTHLPSTLLLSPAVFHIPPSVPVCRSTQLLSCCPRQLVKLHLGCHGDGKAHHHHHRDSLSVLYIWVLLSWPTQYSNGLYFTLCDTE